MRPAESCIRFLVITVMPIAIESIDSLKLNKECIAFALSPVVICEAAPFPLPR